MAWITVRRQRGKHVLENWLKTGDVEDGKTLSHHHHQARLPFNHGAKVPPLRAPSTTREISFICHKRSEKIYYVRNKLPLTLLRRWCFFPLSTETRWRREKGNATDDYRLGTESAIGGLEAALSWWLIIISSDLGQLSFSSLLILCLIKLEDFCRVF